MKSVGLDLGSSFSKVVVLEDSCITGYKILPTAGNYRKTAGELLNLAKEICKVSSFNHHKVTATGFGSSVLPDVKKVTDITCQGIGIHHLFHQSRIVIDVGGQSTKVMKINNDGKVLSFNISEKCAAGSGRFLQIIARIMGIPFNEIGELSLKSTKKIDFSTSCAVFAESEVISRIAEGAAKEDILAAVHRSMSLKISSLARAIAIDGPVVVTGGGVMDKGLVKEISINLGVELLVPDIPMISAAIGAAIAT